MNTIVNISAATTAELVSFYNANCEKVGKVAVKRFADRKTAEKRVAALMAELPVEAKSSRTAAEGIAESWKNPEVAAKRMTRNGCMVNGTEFKSVWAAFQALNLGNSNACIKFRGQLKAEGSKTIVANGSELRFSLI